MTLASACSDPLRWEHPYNQAGAYGDWDTVRQCFDVAEIHDTFRRRQDYIRAMGEPGSVMAVAHNTALLCEGANTAATWTMMSQSEDVRMFCPYLDSRFVRLAMSLTDEVRFNTMLPKASLKMALEKYLPTAVVRRQKLGFGQPILQWLAEDRDLRHMVDGLGAYDFVPPAVIARLRERPTWFLYVLLCYDIWVKEYVDRAQG